MVQQWQAELQTDGKIKLSSITTVIKVFNAAMLRVTSEDGTSVGEYKVEGEILTLKVKNMLLYDYFFWH